MPNLQRNQRGFHGRPPSGPNDNNRQQTMSPWEGGAAPGSGNGMNVSNSYMANQNRGNLGDNHLGNNNNNFGSQNFGGPNMGYQNQNMRNSCGGGLLPTPRLHPGPGLLPEPPIQAQLAAANNVLSLLLPHPQPQQIAMNTVNTNRSGGLLPLNPPGGQFQNNTFRRVPTPSQRSHGPPQGFGVPDQNKKNSSWYQRQHKDNSVSGYISAPSLSEKVGARYNTAGKAENRNEKTSTNDAKQRDKNFDTLKEAYSDISSDLLHCHVCRKKMCDAISFVKHIKGKPHLACIEKLEESYKRQTEIKRRQAKEEEQQNQDKHRQNYYGGPHTFCTMCNLNFVSNLTLHRKGSKHQELKSFLHPTCRECKKEFSARIDWDHHLLSPGHLKEIKNRRSRKLSEGSATKRGNGGVEENSNKRFKQSSQCSDRESEDKVKNSTSSVDANKCDTTSELAVVKEKEDNKVNEPDPVISSPTISKTVISPPASTSVVSVTVNEEEMPASYNPQIEIGMEMMQEKTGYLCRCCNRFLSSQADSKTHCRSRFHYDKYVIYLKNKIRQAAKSCKPNEEVTQTAGPALSQDKMRSPSVDNELQSANTGRDLTSPHSQNDNTSPINNNEKSKEESSQVKLEQEDDEDEEADESENWKRQKSCVEGGETPINQESPGPIG